MSFSRQNPSARYTELAALYRQMHMDGIPAQGIAPENLYRGSSLIAHLPTIKSLVERTGARNLLDYGSGKAEFYQARDVSIANGTIVPSVSEYLGVDRIDCYDPGVDQFASLPASPSDGVISTDALEHCPEEDIGWIVNEIFDLATMFVFANVASYPAVKRLPNGENAHATQRPAGWWKLLLAEVSSRHPGVQYRVDIVERGRRSLTRWFRGGRTVNILTNME